MSQLMQTISNKKLQRRQLMLTTGDGALKRHEQPLPSLRSVWGVGFWDKKYLKMKNGYVLVNKISKSYFRFKIRTKSPKVILILNNNSLRKNNMEN